MKPLGDEVDHYWRVQRMAKATGAKVNDAFADHKLDQSSWAGLVHSCRRCQWTEGCQRWLETHADGQYHPPSQCPNEEVFQTLSPSKGSTRK